MLTKEEMALEALIKMTTEITQSRHVTVSTFEYVERAIKENGWEIIVNEFGMATAKKIV